MKKIVVIDDEDYIVDFLKRILEQNNYRVLTAFNGKEGFELIQRIDPDLIILDLKMPVMDGYKLIEKLQEVKKLKSIPVIVATGLADLNTIVKIRKCGAVDYVIKPFFREEILKRIKKVLNDPDEAADNGKERKRSDKKEERPVIGEVELLKKVSVNELKPGMVLGTPVKHTNKMILLSHGTVLTDSIIEKLVKLNITSVNIIADNE